MQETGQEKERGRSAFLSFYIRQRRRGIFIFFLFCFLFLCAFLLYHLPAGAVVYPALVCSLLGLIFLAQDFARAKKKHECLREFQNLPAVLMEGLPEPKSWDDADYQEIIRRLRQEQMEMENQMNLRYSDMMDYYTTWVHQIKTPIAAMGLVLQKEDTGASRRLAVELSRIEQYVEMVLCYLRLDSDSTDYVFQEYDLDGILRQAVKKYAGQFIQKKIRLEYRPLNVRVVTDEKWLLFVLEQVLSNALKYTPSGSVCMELEGEGTLVIRDTGIGIDAGDLPRIFEKGYTGCNGRRDKAASGLGLYLCRRICRNLGHEITAESAPGQGTAVRICLEQKRERVE